MKKSLNEIISHPENEGLDLCPYCKVGKASSTRKGAKYFVDPVVRDQDGRIVRCNHCGYSGTDTKKTLLVD